MHDQDTRVGTRKVLVSPEFGAGWMTWQDTAYAEDFLFDAELIAAVERGDDLGGEDQPGTPLALFVERLVAKHGEDARHVYLGGARDLEVKEVEGVFIVEEYDGSESILRRDDAPWR
jgi:hypothetical protein